jgi:hypothetical protein
MLFHRFINKTTGEIWLLPTCTYKTATSALNHLYTANAIGYADDIIYLGTHYDESVPMS